MKGRSPSNKITLETAKQRIFAVHGNLVKLVDETYTSFNSKADFIDSEFGKWSATPKIVCSGSRHTKRRTLNWIKASMAPEAKEKRACQKRHDHVWIEKKLQEKHGDRVKLRDGQAYKNSSQKIWFIDRDYGEWQSTVKSVALYGTQHPRRARRDELSKKKYVEIIEHWKTGEKLACTAQYEIQFVNWCNENQIDFDWQIPHKMPNGKTYIVDAYIKSGEFANTWIEIKGTFLQQLCRDKWNWFQSVHSNSQLWTKNELKNVGIKIIKHYWRNKNRPNGRAKFPRAT